MPRDVDLAVWMADKSVVVEVLQSGKLRVVEMAGMMDECTADWMDGTKASLQVGRSVGYMVACWVGETGDLAVD